MRGQLSSGSDARGVGSAPRSHSRARRLFLLATCTILKLSQVTGTHRTRAYLVILKPPSGVAFQCSTQLRRLHEGGGLALSLDDAAARRRRQRAARGSSRRSPRRRRGSPGVAVAGSGLGAGVGVVTAPAPRPASARPAWCSGLARGHRCGGELLRHGDRSPRAADRLGAGAVQHGVRAVADPGARSAAATAVVLERPQASASARDATRRPHRPSAMAAARRLARRRRRIIARLRGASERVAGRRPGQWLRSRRRRSGRGDARARVSVPGAPSTAVDERSHADRVLRARRRQGMTRWLRNDESFGDRPSARRRGAALQLNVARSRARGFSGRRMRIRSTPTDGRAEVGPS